MCTCIAMKTQDAYFGRSMDIDYRFGEKVVVTPRSYPFALRSGGSFETWYAMVGMSAVQEGYPLYAEATNEKGLSMAGLNFPGNARYFKPVPGRTNLTPYEFIPWVLGNFAGVQEVRRELDRVNLTDVPFSPSMPVAELHWMISDGENSLVVEQTDTGLHIYDNPTGVLTNNPEFPFHQMNLNNYMNLSCQPAENRFSSQLKLASYGAGMGSIGLPGDDAPSSRFIRACFCKMNSQCQTDDASSIAQFFHILDAVSIVRGTVKLSDKKCSLTTYACCTNATRGVYYYKSYSNSQLTAVRMTDDNKNADRLSVYEMEEAQAVRYLN
mgnify:CR=1 FL=1